MGRNKAVTINLTKNEKVEVKSNESADKFSKMSGEITNLCENLMERRGSIGDGEYEKEFLEDIVSYIKNYDRIIYTEISNSVFGLYDSGTSPKTAEEKIGNMQTNISKVVDFAYGDEYSEIIERQNNTQKEFFKKAKVIALKIQDHINLAQQQCNSLKQTDEEYKEKFEKNIADFKEDLTKEMNAQLITLVSIFTALAFLLFGGISSLDNIFTGINTTSLLKLMMIGCVWGICLVNLVFVFLFCVSKMTKLPFASSGNQESTIFQKYPVFWWTNYIIVSIFTVTAFLYYMIKNGFMDWLTAVVQGIPGAFFFIIASLLFIIIFQIGRILMIKCNNNLVSKEK